MASQVTLDKNARTWSSYMIEIYASRKGPPLGTLYFDEIEAKAREKLKDRPNAFWYVFGSAGNCAADAANTSELLKWKIIPRMLRDVTVRNLETTLFGVKHKSPLIVAPIGVQGLLHPDGDIATATAARNVGVTFTMSTAGTRSLEEVAKANGSGHRWYQLYWPIHNDITLSLLRRAKASGFSALVVTLDTMTIGWRPHDLANAYLPFIHGVGCQVGFSDPVFMKQFGEVPDLSAPEWPYDPEKFDKLVESGDEATRRRVALSFEWQKSISTGVFRSWEDLKFLRDNWDGPIILKGIMSVEDAELAIDYGMNGISVSNHGGRQVEGSVPAIWALEKICSSPKIKAAQQSGQLTVLSDSGIRTGSDIIKAIALGAQGILLGRPFMYGLAVGGQDGVEQVLRSILADTEITLGLSGYRSLEEIRGKAEQALAKIN